MNHAFETHRRRRRVLRSEIRLCAEPRRDRRQLPPARPPGRLARALLPLGHEGRRADGTRQRLRSFAPVRAGPEGAARPVPLAGRRSPAHRFQSARHAQRPSPRQRADQGIDMPILIDDTQLIGEALGPAAQRRSAGDQSAGLEARVSRPAVGRQLELRGRCGRRARERAAGEDREGRPMKGCAIAMPERDKKQAHAKISYSKTIAPMLIDNCVTCHRPAASVRGRCRATT